MSLSTQPARVQTPFRRALRSFLEQRTSRVGLSLLAVLVIAALGADVFASYSPIDVLIDEEPGAVRLAGPCINLLGCEGPQHIFGLDSNVRDVFAHSMLHSHALFSKAYSENDERRICYAEHIARNASNLAVSNATSDDH